MILGIVASEDFDGSVTPPTITSADAADVADGATLALTLTADMAVTWSITGGADAALFEIHSGNVLRFLANATHARGAPADADANNAYLVEVTADAGLSNITAQTVSIYVTDASGWFTAWAAGSAVSEQGDFGAANTRQQFAETFLRGGSQVRVTFAAAAAHGLVVNGAGLGTSSNVAPSYNFTGDQVALTFSGGSPGFSIAAGAEITSDAATFTVTGARLVIALLHGSSSYMSLYAGVAFSLLDYKATASDETLTTAPGGYGAWGAGNHNVIGVKKVEVKT